MNKANFHHIHLNVTDVNKSIAFYEKYFGAKRIRYRGKSDALFTEKSFLLFDEVNEAPETHDGSSLWHIGWSGVDGPSEFDWRVKGGIEGHTPINSLKDSHLMDFFCADKEVVGGVNGNRNHSFEHIYLFATD
ncbi:MAG: VOC family protein, partial [Allomuricauda sp.]